MQLDMIVEIEPGGIEARARHRMGHACRA